MRRYLPTVIVLLVLINAPITMLRAQESSRTTINVVDSDNNLPLVGANVTIQCGKEIIQGAASKYDTQFATFAQFVCDRLFKDSVSLRVSFLGYKPFEKRYGADQFKGYFTIEMKPDQYMMSQIVITGSTIAMVVKGDTTIYNAAAFKTISGDRFSELIKQLPGVEIKDNKIYAGGVEVKRVYVDGLNLFGANTSYSLTDLEAADVKRVKVYEQDDMLAQRLGDRTAPKETVMNVETHSKRKVVQGGSVSVAAGASLDKDYSGRHEIRHSQDLSLYRNSESGNIRLSASNSKDDGPKESASFGSKLTPKKQTNANISYEYRRGDTTNVRTYVNFMRSRSSRVETTLMDYFPSTQYNQRLTESVSEAMSQSHRLTAGNEAILARKKSVINTSVNFSADNSTNSIDGNTKQSLEQQDTYTNLRRRDNLHNREAHLFAIYRGAIAAKSIITASIMADYSTSNRGGWSVDTMTSTSGLRVLLNSDSHARQTNVSASGEYKRELSKNSSLSLSYSYTRDYNQSRQMSIDFLSDPQGAMDSTNSYDYTVNAVWNSLEANWNYRRNKFNCMAIVRASLYEAKQDERLPEYGASSHHFLLLNPIVNLSLGDSKSRFKFGIGSSSSLLSVEMLRNSLSISNPMYVQAGNPDIKPSNNVSFHLEYSTMNAEKANSWSFGITGGYVFNYIATKRQFFMEDTYLATYDYTIKKGAQLTSNVNVDGNLTLGALVDYSKRLSFLKSTVRASLKYNYAEMIYFLSDSPLKAYNHEAKIVLGINTGFSSKVKIDLRSSTGLGYYTTQNELSRYINESLDGKLNLNFATKYFATLGAVYELYRNSKSSSLNQSNVIANAALKRKFGKENKVAISIGVVDIFNRTNYISTIINSDYIRTKNTSYLGRYAYVMLLYAF